MWQPPSKYSFYHKSRLKGFFESVFVKKLIFRDVVDVTQKKELGGSLQTRVIEKAAEPETAFPPQR